MRVVDTSALIEWFSRSPTGAAVRAKFPDRADWLVPTIVQLELAKWLMCSTTRARTERELAFALTCRVVPLDTQIAFAAAEVSARHKLSTADGRDLRHGPGQGG